MNIKKLILSSSSIICLMAIYNILVFVLTKNLTRNFWVGYIFVMIAFLFMIASFVLTYASKNEGKVTGLPLTTLSVYYFIFTAILANALMFVNISFVAIILPLIITLLLFLMIYIPAVIKLYSIPKN